ncbi:Crp/Fnr family transcriptional regulator [Roseateles cellulosilyticus]|uniref:Crp/Fnr family transcriptional regulator n=1 Tax=Pelomonas cellulosilytica TaxID=2906762 RepID=A0ABS8XSL6_9BURK|nr:Crp/Fnr family transcriptional regulator [Pelomonas sp. P8]MCE4555714.1 Crp/Fnr family transcriptional regulator [Pelomonas sp. P8]
MPFPADPVLAPLAELAARAQPMRVPAGTRLFDAGRPCPGFPLVDEGSVRVSLASPDGRQLELYRVEPGEVCVVSATCLFAHRVATASGEARTETALRLISPADFEAVCESDPVLRRYVMGLMAERLADLMALVEAVAFQRLDQRLAALLCARGPQLHTTHQQLADELGTVREIVSRLLRRFERDGWVALGRERIDIADRAALQRLCVASSAV